jgi:hypothetical protein
MRKGPDWNAVHPWVVRKNQFVVLGDGEVQLNAMDADANGIFEAGY